MESCISGLLARKCLYFGVICLWALELIVYLVESFLNLYFMFFFANRPPPTTIPQTWLKTPSKWRRSKLFFVFVRRVNGGRPKAEKLSEEKDVLQTAKVAYNWKKITKTYRLLAFKDFPSELEGKCCAKISQDKVPVFVMEWAPQTQDSGCSSEAALPPSCSASSGREPGLTDAGFLLLPFSSSLSHIHGGWWPRHPQKSS